MPAVLVIAAIQRDGDVAALVLLQAHGAGGRLLGQCTAGVPPKGPALLAQEELQVLRGKFFCRQCSTC